MSLDPQAVATAPSRRFEGEAFRHQSPNYEPLNGEGARINGGRFNPPESFPVLYLCTTRPCTVAEFHRLGQRHQIGAEGLLPRVLFRYEVELTTVLDLSEVETRAAVGLTREEITDYGWSRTQELGELAHALEFQAILASSATGVNSILTVFLENVRGDVVVPSLLERWERIEDV